MTTKQRHQQQQQQQRQQQQQQQRQQQQHQQWQQRQQETLANMIISPHMTKIFLLNRGALFKRTDFLMLNDRSNIDFVALVEEDTWPRSETYKHVCTDKIKVVEIPTEYYEKKWYKIKNTQNPFSLSNKTLFKVNETNFVVHQTSWNETIFKVCDDEELVLLHEKCKLSDIDSVITYINTGKNILLDHSTNPEKKVELLAEFMSNIIENPLEIFDSLSERADFFPGYGDKYFDALKSWKRSIEEQES